MAKKEKQGLNPEQQTEILKAFAAVLKESKMLQMILCFFILQAMRKASKRECWQGIMTMLQTVCVGGYLSSELEGELASTIGLGTIAGGSIAAAIACSEPLEITILEPGTEGPFAKTVEAWYYWLKPWEYEG